MYLIENVDRHSTDIATGVSTEESVDTPYQTHDDTPEIILIRPRKDIVKNKKEQLKKRRFCLKYCEVKPAQKIRTNIAMTYVSG